MKSQLWAVGEEAACPFKHHTQASLHQLLQPSSQFALREFCSLVDAGNYSGACRLYLDSLTVESCSNVCSRISCASYIAGKSIVDVETVSPEHAHDRQSDGQVAETLDSGYDSAQSCQPMLENNYTSVSLNQSSELAGTGTRFTSMSGDARNPERPAVSHVHQQCNIITAVPSKPDDQHICNVQQHIVGSDCDTVAHKLHSPVDFYTSFNCLMTGLQCTTVS